MQKSLSSSFFCALLTVVWKRVCMHFFFVKVWLSIVSEVTACKVEKYNILFKVCILIMYFGNLEMTPAIVFLLVQYLFLRFCVDFHPYRNIISFRMNSSSCHFKRFARIEKWFGWMKKRTGALIAIAWKSVWCVPVRFSASLMAMSSSTVGSERPFWFTLYATKCSVGAYESDGSSSME